MLFIYRATIPQQCVQNKTGKIKQYLKLFLKNR